MRVGIQREAGGEVAEDSGESFYVDAILQSESGISMPQVMEAQVFQTCGF